MDAYKAIVSKRDTRAFADQPVDRDVLSKVLQAGRMAGSAKNLQPCRFVVVEDLETKQRLGACGDFSSWIHTAPVNVAVVIPADGREFDSGRAAQNLMVAAHAFGLASCPVTMHRNDDARAVLGIPDSHRIAIVVVLGHPAPGGGGRLQGKRLPFDEYVHWGRW